MSGAEPAAGEEARARERHASRRMMQVAEWELQRILLDIHDGPVQAMYAALSQLDLLRRALEEGAPPDDQGVTSRLDRIRLLLESGLSEVRSFIGAFRPPEFRGRALRALLEGLILQHEAATDTQVEFEVEGVLPEVGLPVKIALYRVLQEGLSNAYRHGGADRVSVRLGAATRGGEPWVEMRVRDNGAGFDAAALPAGDHYGLAGMRDRVEMVGGRFRLESAPGRGATIAVEVPAA